MNKTLALALVVLAWGFASCAGNTAKPSPENQSVENSYADADFLYIEDGDLFFYEAEKQEATRYPNEADEVVDAVCASEKVYYNVLADNRLLLKSIDLNEANPMPVTLTDWNVDLNEENEYGYPPFGNMIINRNFTQIGLEVDLTWLAGEASNLAVYDCATQTVSKLERYAETWYDDMLDEDGFDIYREEQNFDDNLFESSDHLYYYGDGQRVCLSDRIDEEDVTGFNEYGMYCEPIALDPSGTKLLFCESIGMGDSSFGFYAVSSLDGTEQMYVADLDDDFVAPVWLNDGSLLFRGYDSDAVLLMMDPDGDVQTVAHTHKFCMLR